MAVGNDKMLDFIAEILIDEYKIEYQVVFDKSFLLQYLNLKMKAVNGNSKTRRSFGNIYAIYSLLIEYRKIESNSQLKYEEFKGTNFTTLWSYCRAMYGGSKLQNHSFNSRVDREFVNRFKGNNLIVQHNGLYKINTEYIEFEGYNISDVAIKTIEKYVDLIKYKDEELARRLVELANFDEQRMKEGIKTLVSATSEARIFEITSFAILRNYYKSKSVYFGYTQNSVVKHELQLFKTGRTNANDGGIDFVMQPVGRFFQVTEVGNFDKYLLDIDKVIHFPITFVVKSNKTHDELLNEFREYIKRKVDKEEVRQRYFDSIEEIITVVDLQNYVNRMSIDEARRVLDDVDIYYKLEMNEENEE